MALAHPHAQVAYVVAPAERVPLSGASVDLVAAAAALHWLDLPAFYAEVRRVARPGGILAAWSYVLPRVGLEVDAAVRWLYADVLGSDWPPKRRFIETCYRTLPFPFEEIRPPRFEMTARWDLGRFAGYLRTWSASLRHLDRTGADPIEPIWPELASAWGGPAREREIIWALFLRVGQVTACA